MDIQTKNFKQKFLYQLFIFVPLTITLTTTVNLKKLVLETLSGVLYYVE